MTAAIGIDGTFIAPGAVGGAEHMLRNLVGGFVDAFPDDQYLILTRGDLELPVSENVATMSFPAGENRFLAGWRGARRAISSLDAMLFGNYFTAPVHRARSRVVTVIHDLQYRHLPDNFSARKRVWLRAAHELTLRYADVVVTVSESVRRDVISQYGERWAQKVISIPNPISWDRFEDAGFSPGVELLRQELEGRPYILCVSAHYPHKNLETLIRAFALMRKERADKSLALVLVGQRARALIATANATPLESFAEELGTRRDVIVVGYADDRVTGDLYRGARAFVMPSLFEGFGMPAVEALGFGLPVVTTRAGGLPEVTLGLARYVTSPHRPEEFAEALAAVVDDPERHRPTPEEVGRIREQYDPVRIARAYRQILVGHDA